MTTFIAGNYGHQFPIPHSTPSASDSGTWDKLKGFHKRSGASRQDEITANQYFVGTSTAKISGIDDIHKVSSEVEYVFDTYSDEVYDDKEEDRFSIELEAVIWRWGIPAVDIIYNNIQAGVIKGIVITKTLEIFGDVRHPSSYNHRLWMLETFLFSPSPRIRDGACLGLSLINDFHSLPFLQMAASSEKIAELKLNLENLIRQLNYVKNAHSLHH
ncbi:MAG: hypothetical protein WA821_06925 [Anaerolineales bacterium]